MAAKKPADLLQLAESATHAEGRIGDVYTAVATLFEANAGAFSQRERELAADICKRLSKNVEMQIRLSLAERLADNGAAPRELVLLLADDRIEVARPVLLRSRALNNDDLVRIARAGTPEHQITVASRPEIAECVSAALAQCPSERVVLALVRNNSARISDDIFGLLTERARTSPLLHAPLTERHDLPHAAAARLFAIVSDALKSALAQRYPAAASVLSRALDETSQAVQRGTPGTSEANAEKLVAKLAQGGQLRASFLIRVLYQGQMDLFEHGFATLLGLPIGDLRRALYQSTPRVVALACRAAGIDRCVFATVYNIARHYRQASTTLGDADRHEVDLIFTEMGKTTALDALKIVLSA